MTKNYTDLNHLYIRLPEYSDVSLLKELAKEYYDTKMMRKGTYDFWLNRDYNIYFKFKEDAIHGGLDGVYTYTYYLIDEDKIVGIGSLRLNPEDNLELNMYGGHIGYGIIPSKRKCGYGSMFLHLLIKEAACFGLKEVMVVCSDDNITSSRVIENNFGIFKNQVIDSKHNSILKKYIIDVDKSVQEFEGKYLKLAANKKMK